STTVARNGVGRSHVLQLKAGQKFVVIGEDGNTWRCLLSPHQSVNILKTQMRLLPVGAPIPRVYFGRIEARIVKSSTRNDTEVRFGLPDRVPFTVEQNAIGNEQVLDVRLFNSESDVDYFVSAFPDELVKNVTWKQESDGVFHARIFLKARWQWGFQSFYDGNALVVRIKRAPQITRKQPLLGRSVVVDAGHGGTESGAPGAFGIDEKDLMLDIAKRLATKLKKRGALVTMTRDKDVTVPIYERPLLAEKLNADVLISIHANALPDGVDPNQSRGAGVYYYQPQARPLAESVLGALLKGVPETGNDGIHYQNLALTRPSSQLSILVETAFMTDKSNLRLLMSQAGRERIAESLARGLEDFYRAQNTRR
ncbi:MAG TPA: N-acetylmuramoyl-L-alanine amidase, partial [Abditibacteriaceae bacterium]|nr:N-acetylmuramoyl-L-alanine amidase [Abditibacteriaceae bacterium]